MYKEHCKNLKKLSKSIKILEGTIKQALKTENVFEAKIHTNIHTFLTGSWMEVSFYKLIHEKQFTIDDRNLILANANSLEGKWSNVLKWAFARAFSIQLNPQNFTNINIENSLGRTHQNRYKDVLTFINTDINEVISMRNKIAHGQWHYTFNNDVSSLEPSVERLIHSNTYFISKKRLETVKLVIEMITKISTSPRTFERDFDEIYSKIEILEDRYSRDKYRRNIEVMKNKFNRADNWKTNNRN